MAHRLVLLLLAIGASPRSTSAYGVAQAWRAQGASLPAVVDPHYVLSPTDQQHLLQEMHRSLAGTPAAFVVIGAPAPRAFALGEEAKVRAFARELFPMILGFGRGAQHGLLIVYAVDRRSYCILPGARFQDVVPPVVVGQIGASVQPMLAAGQYLGAFASVVMQLGQRVKEVGAPLSVFPSSHGNILFAADQRRAYRASSPSRRYVFRPIFVASMLILVFALLCLAVGYTARSDYRVYPAAAYGTNYPPAYAMNYAPSYWWNSYQPRPTAHFGQRWGDGGVATSGSWSPPVFVGSPRPHDQGTATTGTW